MAYSGAAAYYDQSCRYKTPVFYCGPCDIFYRRVDQRRLVSHYYAASYVQGKNEESLFRGRVEFFRWILSLGREYGAVRAAGEPGLPVLLDFGSAYGHLLRLAGEQGFHAVGVELNEDLVRACRKRGLTVYGGIDEVPGKVDVVTALDSLYCVADPRSLLAALRDKLQPGGVFLARVTNRNLFARLRAKFVHPGDFSVIGDATVSYSLKGIRKLLDSSGFRIQAVIPDHGQGKKLGARRRLFYGFTYLLTLAALKRRVLTPGIIVIATVADP